MANVYIAVPSRTKGFWSAYMGILIASGVAAQKGIRCVVKPHVGTSLICRARQNITYEFLYENTNCDYFLQLDDDVALPPDGIVKLVESGKRVVGGMYSLKSKAGKVAIRGLGDEIFKLQDFPDQLKEVKYVSGGCFMQTRDVAQWAWDYYKPTRGYEANDRTKSDGSPERQRVALYTPFIYKNEYLSEDWAYCQRLIDIGEKIWLHTGVACVHWGLAPYGIDTGKPDTPEETAKEK